MSPLAPRRRNHAGTRWTRFRIGAIVAITCIAPPSAAAGFTVNYANADTSRWSCRLCEFDKATERSGAVSAGAMQSTDGEMRFGRDNGIDRAGGYLGLNADYRIGTAGGLILEFVGRHLGLKSRDAALGIRKPSRYGVRVRYREIPHNIARDGRTPFIGSDTLLLPADWVAAPTTGDMTHLVPLSRPFVLATERRRSDIDAWFHPAPRLTLRTGYFIERKRGTAQTYRDAFHQSTALPEPIDYHTEGAEAGLTYEHPVVMAALFYRHRRFDNDHDALEWRNPYAASQTIGRSAVAPGNKTDTFSFISRIRLGRHTTINASLVRSDARQHVPFLPYTTNESLNLPPITEKSLNGKRESDSHVVNIVSRPMRRLRLSVSHGEVERNDRRPAIVLTPVLGDLFATRETTALGYSFKRRKTDIAARYKLPGALRVAAGFRNVDLSRTNLEIAANEENRVWVEVTGDIGNGWRLSAYHAGADRDASEFHANTPNNPLTRRFHQADRRDNEWRGTIRFDSNSTGFSAGLDLDYRKHRYPDSPLGLQREVARGWFLDVAYAAGTAASLSGFYGERTRRSETAGSLAYPTGDWRYDIEDRVTSAGARLRADGFLHPTVGLTVDYAYSNGVGDYSTSFENLVSGFPSLVSRHESVDVRLRHAWRARTDLVLRYYFERFRAADWAIDGFGQDSIRNVLSFGRSSPRYRNHLIALSVERRL